MITVYAQMKHMAHTQVFVEGVVIMHTRYQMTMVGVVIVIDEDTNV
jgi:hypothetical protein